MDYLEQENRVLQEEMAAMQTKMDEMTEKMETMAAASAQTPPPVRTQAEASSSCSTTFCTLGPAFFCG